MRCHGQGWGNRTTGVRCPGVYGATGRLVACIALGHGSDKPGAGMDTDTEKRHVRSSTGPFTNRPKLHSASVFPQTRRLSYTFRGTWNREKRDLNKTCEQESFQFALRRCWWDVEDTGLAQDSRGLEPGPAMGLVSTLGDIQRTTIEQL